MIKNILPIMDSEYNKIVIGFTLAIIICLLMCLAATVLSASTLKDSEKLSQYECGFEPFDNASRQPFEVHFYIVGILFLIFDVEIALLFPWVLSFELNKWCSFYIMNVFLLLLTIGFFYEWHKGALNWPHGPNKKMNNNNKFENITPYFLNLRNTNNENNIKGKINSKSFNKGLILSSFITIKEINLNTIDWFWITPEIFLLIVICGALYTVSTKNLFNVQTTNEIGNNDKLTTQIIMLIRMGLFTTCLLYCIYVYLYIAYPRTNWSCILFNGYMIVNIYTVFFKLLILYTTISIIDSSLYYTNKHPRQLLEYTIQIALAALFLLFLVSSYNLITLFISIIGVSICNYVLLLSDSFEQRSREANIKYFLVSILSSGLLLCGILLAYSVFGTTNYSSINTILNLWEQNGRLSIIDSGVYPNYFLFIIFVMLSFIVTGILFLLSAFPGHSYAPEVYEGSPDGITAFFVIPVKIAAFGTLIYLLFFTFKAALFSITLFLWIASAVSMLIGAINALTETKIKRFIAYSSINQIGFLVMAFASGTIESVRAAFIFMIIYIISNVLFFLIYLNTRDVNTNRPLIYMNDLKYFAKKNPLLSFMLLLILANMAGLPPFAGFFGKYFLLLHTYESGYKVLVIIGLITSLISAFYYFRLIHTMWFEATEQRYDLVLNFQSKLSKVQVLSCFVLSYILITFILYTDNIIAFLNNIIHSISF